MVKTVTVFPRLLLFPGWIWCRCQWNRDRLHFRAAAASAHGINRQIGGFWSRPPGCQGASSFCSPPPPNQVQPGNSDRWAESPLATVIPEMGADTRTVKAPRRSQHDDHDAGLSRAQNHENNTTPGMPAAQQESFSSSTGLTGNLSHLLPPPAGNRCSPVPLSHFRGITGVPPACLSQHLAARFLLWGFSGTSVGNSADTCRRYLSADGHGSPGGTSFFRGVQDALASQASCQFTEPAKTACCSFSPPASSPGRMPVFRVIP